MLADDPGRIDARDHEMTRVLLQSAAFVRAARRLMKKHPEAGPTLEATFAALMEDAFQAVLKTHKLKGELAGSGDGYRCPWVPLIPLVYLILPLFLFFNMLQKQPSEAVMGILFSLFGMITYLTFYKGKGRIVDLGP